MTKISKYTKGIKFENQIKNFNYEIVNSYEKPLKFKIIRFKLCLDRSFVWVKKGWFRKYVKQSGFCNPNVVIARGCLEPDEVFINKNKVFIVEYKFQQCRGSADEKLQTGVFKKEHYQSLYPQCKIELIFCLSNWFKQGYEPELSYLQKNKICIFWGEDINWQRGLVNFLIKHTN